MKVKIPLFVLILLAVTVGYLMGTASGQEQRDRLLQKLGRRDAEVDFAISVAEQAIEDAATT